VIYLTGELRSGPKIPNNQVVFRRLPVDVITAGDETCGIREEVQRQDVAAFELVLAHILQNTSSV